MCEKCDIERIATTLSDTLKGEEVGPTLKALVILIANVLLQGTDFDEKRSVANVEIVAANLLAEMRQQTAEQKQIHGQGALH